MQLKEGEVSQTYSMNNDLLVMTSNETDIKTDSISLIDVHDAVSNDKKYKIIKGELLDENIL